MKNGTTGHAPLGWKNFSQIWLAVQGGSRCDEDHQWKKALQPLKISFENFKIMTAPGEVDQKTAESFQRSQENVV